MPEPIELLVLTPDPIELFVLMPEPIELLVLTPDPIELFVLMPEPIELSALTPDPTRTVIGSIKPPRRGCVPRISTLLPDFASTVGKETIAPLNTISPELTRASEIRPARYTGVAPGT